MKIELYNLLGVKLYTETLNDFSGVQEKEIDLSNFAKGIYFMQVRFGDKVIVRKVIYQ